MKKAEKRKHLDSLEQHLLPIKKFEFHLLKCVISALFSFHAWVRNKSIRFLHTNCTYYYLWKYSVVIYTLMSIFERNTKQVQGLTNQKIRLITFMKCSNKFNDFSKYFRSLGKNYLLFLIFVHLKIFGTFFKVSVLDFSTVAFLSTQGLIDIRKK